ncbi:MAG: SGNH/GDSL hydrolase family protein [Gemmatimonadetes bacterium]|nr:SGNH/GDSL hydrolase family protein [Gemmatimonadota bacterium]
MKLDRWLTVLLAAGGVLATAAAFGADLLSAGSSDGFGAAQLALLLTGLGALSVAPGFSIAGVRESAHALRASRRDLFRNAGRYAVLLVQLALVLVVVRTFKIESPAFYDRIAWLIVAGFAVHYLLPARSRLTFFVLLSLSGVWLVFGTVGALWLAGIGLGLIALCHLPIAFGLRIALLLGVGAGLAAMRAQWFEPPFPGAIWPVLGSMFMFRLIVYMYDLRHSRDATDWRRTLAYFFLLPNVVFPLFPVIDWSTFKRTYYDQERHGIYQRGIQWISRGIMHLLLYRVAYQYLTLAPEQVGTPLELARFMVSTFLLYLRVSGQFHLIVGLLHLFGFRLPETHRLFYLASSFSDLWRRINIYWKDFMMKVVYYPALFRFKRYGQTTGIVLATLIVFTVTWFLHAYQWFWLLGNFLLTWPDVLFWLILALLLIGNTLFDLKHGRTRALNAGPRWSLARVASTAVTFAVFCVLWSFWSSHEVGDWLALWSVFGAEPTADDRLGGLIAPLVLGIGMVAMAGGSPPGTRSDASRILRLIRGSGSFRATAARTGAALALFALLGSPTSQRHLGGDIAEVLRDVRTPHLTARDANLMRRGYYESLTTANPLNSALFDVYMRRPSRAEWPNVLQAGLARSTGDILHWELLPLRAEIFHGAIFRTNRWGMRDQDYPRKPAPDAYRIAMLGASYVMGDGVADDETFEAVLERLLEMGRQSGDPRVEILNFGTPNYFPLRHLELLRRKVFTFEPDAVFMISHVSDGMDYPHLIVTALQNGYDIPFDFIRRRLDQLGIDAGTSREEVVRRLEPHIDAMLEDTYVAIVAACRERGAVPMWVNIPTPNLAMDDDRHERLKALAKASGFTIIDVGNVYGEDPRRFWIAEWDYHPNAEGHRRIAEALRGRMMDLADEIPIGRRGPIVLAPPTAGNPVTLTRVDDAVAAPARTIPPARRADS